MRKNITNVLAILLLSSLTLFNLSAQAPTCPTVKDFNSWVANSTSAVVSWTGVAGAKSYDLVVSQAKPIPISPITFELKGVTITKQLIEKLTAGTVYTYTIKTNCTNGTSSELSKIGEFTTKSDNGTGNNDCGAVKDLAFASDADGTSGTLKWETITNAKNYNVYVQETGTSSTQTFVATTNTLAIKGLKAGSKYLVKIQAVCASGTGTPTTFTIETKKPTTPVGCGSVKEIGVSQKDTTAAYVKWSAVTSAVSYEIEVTGKSITKTYKSTTNSVVADGLKPGSYTVKVRAICKDGTGSWSSAKDFKIISKSIPVSSGCGTVKTIKVMVKDSLSAYLAWSVVIGAKSYEVSITDSTGFKLALTATSNMVSTSALKGNGYYTVKVRAICTSGTGEWSKAYSFRTKKKDINGGGGTSSTECTTPSGLTTKIFNTTTAQLYWNISKNAVSYEIEVLELTPISSTPPTTLTFKSKINTIIVDNFTAGKSYTFRVKAVCATGKSEWSKYADFKLKTEAMDKVAHNNGNNIALNGFNLISAVYPNPANNEVNVIINGKEGEGNLLIMNMLGSVVKTMQVTAGSSYQINVNDLTAGHYFIRVQMGTKTESKRLTIQ